MLGLKPVSITEDKSGKSYYFSDNIFFKIVYRSFRKEEFYFYSPTINLFADTRNRSPIDLYTDQNHHFYLISLHFDKSFPLFHKDKLNLVTWSTFQFKTSFLDIEKNLVWLKDGKNTIELKLKSVPFSNEKLYYKGNPTENYLELFASMIYMYFYYRPDRSFKF